MVLKEFNPEEDQDFAAVFHAGILQKDHNTRGKRVDYTVQYGSQSTISGGSQSQSQSQSHHATGRGRQEFRKQYYPPISGERRRDKDCYVRGRSTEAS